MRTILALLIGIAVGGAVVWFYAYHRNDQRLQSAGENVQNAARSAGDAAQSKLRELHLRPEDIKDELARTGQVVRRTATQAGHALADATADARITGAIKAKLLASRDLSVLSISVNTTDGVVTLSGNVATADDVGKAVMVAMSTDGVREVVSTLQVKPKGK